ncbi:MAG: hypothetical protein PVJ64_07440 [Gemmatimonadales bacterium]|jgi:hypothetical protein
MRRCSPIELSFVALAWLAAADPTAAQDTTDSLQVINDVEAKELVFVVGPVDLPAGAGHHMVKQPPLLEATVPIDAYLTGFDVEMVDAGGRPMTQRVLHHVNLIDPDSRELFSPVARRLFAAGSETQPASVPRLIGVPVKEGQRLVVSAMFHNPTELSYPGARLHVRLAYRTRGWFFPVGVQPVYIDVMGHVGAKEFDLPPGRTERSWQGSPAIPGRLLGAGGHLHDHAMVLRFEDVTEGKVLWETRPELDEEGHVVKVPIGQFWWKGGIVLRPEHTYRLTVIYDNPTGRTLPGGGMGVLGGVFKPGEDWPRLDPRDPLYVANMDETQRTAAMRATGMDMTHGAHEGRPEIDEHQH